jgi:hypothetical protein
MAAGVCKLITATGNMQHCPSVSAKSQIQREKERAESKRKITFNCMLSNGLVAINKRT